MRVTNWDEFLLSSPVRSLGASHGSFDSQGAPAKPPQAPDLIELWKMDSWSLPGGSWSGMEGQETVAVHWWFLGVTSEALASPAEAHSGEHCTLS